MDAERFDAFSRALALATTRRRVLGSLLGAVGAALAGISPPRLAAETSDGPSTVACGQWCAEPVDCKNYNPGTVTKCGECCNGICVSFADDPMNCGACGNVCPGGQYAACEFGGCTLHCPGGGTDCTEPCDPLGDTFCPLVCPDGWTDCGGYCADLLNDPVNCLSCGIGCFAGQVCCGELGCIDLQTDLYHCGACGVACPAGWTCCFGRCTDVQSDPADCGGCGSFCGGGQVCEAGTCLSRCPAGMVECPAGCVDVGSDPANCGGCGIACNWEQTCQTGTCVDRCPPRQVYCDPDCADLLTDTNNCGACRVLCAPGEECLAGACLPPCRPGETRCDDACVDLIRDRSNCGRCGERCPGAQECRDGACSCPDDRAYCDPDCVDLQRDADHCGDCDHVCPEGHHCRFGHCVAPGFPGLIESDFGDDTIVSGSRHGNFEAVVLHGRDLRHWWRDNTRWRDPEDDSLPEGWHMGQVITNRALSAGSLIQSTLGNGDHRNFEVLVLEEDGLHHYWHDNSSVGSPWIDAGVVSARATGPSYLIQGTLGDGSEGNLETLVLEGNELWHYWHDSTDPNSEWHRAGLVTDKATGPGCLIQSNLGGGDQGNFEAVVLEGSELKHYWHDTNDPGSGWHFAGTVTDRATGVGCLIQTTFGDPGNLELVVPEGRNLVHYFHDSTDPKAPWQPGQIITTVATTFEESSAHGGIGGAIIQSTFREYMFGRRGCEDRLDFVDNESAHRHFEVLVHELTKSVVFYHHDNYDPSYLWLRLGPLCDYCPEISEPRPGQSLDELNERTKKIAQVTGANSINGPEMSLLGIRGTDLGASFEHRASNGEKRTYFLFGDSFGWSVTGERDLIAFTNAEFGDALTQLDLTFLPPPLTVPGIGQCGMEVPVEGVSHNGTMYVYFATDSTRAAVQGRSVLTRSTDDGRTFSSPLYDLSTDRFINVSIQKVRNPGFRPLTEHPRDQEDLGDVLMIWGSGRYRASDISLAYIPLAGIEDRANMRYLRRVIDGQPDWSTEEQEAIPLFPAGSMGEFSVRWNPYLNLWVMFYGADTPRGFYARVARQPWGPWSKPRQIFDAGQGYGVFMHAADPNRPDDNLADDVMTEDRSGEWGGEYAPYQIASAARGIEGGGSYISFLMSTWNPYQVFLMETKLLPTDFDVE